MNKNSSYSRAKMNSYIALTVLAMLPSAAVGINFIILLLKDISYHLSFEGLTAAAQNKTILSEVGVVAAWFIPLLFGCFAANILLQRRKIIPGLILGFVLISVSYWALSTQVGRDIAECAQKWGPECEFVGLGYLIYIAMWGANAAALTGFVVLVNQIRLKRDANVQLADK